MRSPPPACGGAVFCHSSYYKIKKTFPTTTWTTSTDTTTAAVALVILDSTLSCRWRSVGDMRVFEELKSGFRGDAVKVQISGCRKSPSRRGRCGQLLATSSVLSTRSKVLSIPPRARQIFTVRSLRQRKTGNNVIAESSAVSKWQLHRVRGHHSFTSDPF